MKYRDPDTREFKDITVKTSDTLPIGTIVDYDGTEVPSGWENVENYGIKKDFYDKYDVKELLEDNRLTKEQIVEDVKELIK